MYASKTPRDLNHDRFPVRIHGSQARSQRFIARDDIRDPRPEFDHVQHNEPNPILVSFRSNDMNPRASDWAKWLVRPSLGAWHHADSTHIDHARKVLTRLANLEAS